MIGRLRGRCRRRPKLSGSLRSAIRFQTFLLVIPRRRPNFRRIRHRFQKKVSSYNSQRSERGENGLLYTIKKIDGDTNQEALAPQDSTTTMLRPPRSVVSVLSRQVERSTGARCLSSGTPPVLNPFKPRGGPRTSRSGRSTRQDPSSSSTGPQYDPPPESRYQQSPGSQGYGFGGTGTGAGGFGGSPFSPFGAAAGGFGGGGNSFSSTDPAAVPVHIPSDPEGVLRETDGATRLLGNSALVIVRQLEMLNVFMGFEQANRYAILSPQGDHVG